MADVWIQKVAGLEYGLSNIAKAITDRNNIELEKLKLEREKFEFEKKKYMIKE